MTKENKRKGSVVKVCVTGALVAGLSVACIPGAIAYSTEKTEAVELAAEQKATPAEYEKTEVVYATLSATGATKGVYVVNQFDVSAAGAIEDFGTYSTVANLTDQGALKYADGATSFEAGEGAFYYQGNAAVDSVKLPWNVAISYTLDGAAISPEDVAGKSGELGIHLTTSRAEGVDAAFADSYMLQITLTLNGDTATDIVAEGATIASAGRDRTIAFAALPGKNADCALTAKVSDFEMAGIQIAALPYSMVMEMPETDEMTEGIGELSGAINEMSSGLSELSAGSSGLVTYSSYLLDAMNAIEFMLPSEEEMEGMQQVEIPENMPEQMRLIAASIGLLKDSIDTTSVAYRDAYKKLGTAIEALDAKIRDLPSQLYTPVAAESSAGGGEGASGTTFEPVEINLQGAYYDVVSAYNDSAFAGTGDLFAELASNSGVLSQMQDMLLQAADLLDKAQDSGVTPEQMAEMVAGLRELAANYDQFHDGLVEYTGGVSQMASGMKELNSNTIDLPATMRAEIEKMMEEYDFPEFDPISFVDDRNDERMVAVQFVLTTDAISVEEPEAEVEEEEVDQNIVDRFLALFE